MNLRNYVLALQHPQMIMDKINGLYPLYSYMCIKTKEILSPGTVIDVGANDGHFLKSFNKYFKARTIAFEPNKDFHEVVSKLCDESYAFGLGDKNRDLKFYYKKIEHGTNSFLHKHDSNEHMPKDYDEIRKVLVYRFDSLKIDISRPCLLKLDVEGYELKVLEGFGKRLNEVDAVLLEYNSEDNYVGQPTIKQIADILDKYGIKRMKCLLQDDRGGDYLFYR
jgi:FkbM family methyltransferase